MNPVLRIAAAALLGAAAVAAAAAPAAPPAKPSAPVGNIEAERYQTCLATAGREPALAVTEATKWLGGGGGVPARHCLALAYLAQQQYIPAALALEAAAQAAAAAKDPHVGELWGQAGNAALAGNDAARALGYFTTALGTGVLGVDRAEVLIDRARAAVELKRDAAARTDLDEAVRLDPASPYGWLLRATLARRDGDLKSAETSILEAGKRAPEDPDVALEAGNIAVAQGNLTLARQAWSAAAASSPPGSPANVAASQALAANPDTGVQKQ